MTWCYNKGKPGKWWRGAIRGKGSGRMEGGKGMKMMEGEQEIEQAS